MWCIWLVAHRGPSTHDIRAGYWLHPQQIAGQTFYFSNFQNEYRVLGRATIAPVIMYCMCTGMLVALYQHMHQIRTCVMTWLFTTFLAAHRDQLVSFETHRFCVCLTSIHFSMHLFRAAALLSFADALRMASFLALSVCGLVRGLCFLTIVQLLLWKLVGH